MTQSTREASWLPSPSASAAEHLFMGSLAMCASSLQKCLLKTFVCFLNFIYGLCIEAERQKWAARASILLTRQSELPRLMPGAPPPARPPTWTAGRQLPESSSLPPTVCFTRSWTQEPKPGWLNLAYGGNWGVKQKVEAVSLSVSDFHTK